MGVKVLQLASSADEGGDGDGRDDGGGDGDGNGGGGERIDRRTSGVECGLRSGSVIF
jgi:hypothetical protein